MATVGFDIISDLHLDTEESFNWEGKATSLYCIIAGNLSDNLRVLHQTLLHLSKFYSGVFYVAGSLEYTAIDDVTARTEEIYKICKSIKGVAFLYQHVVVVDGVAIVGANGWYGNTTQVYTGLDYLQLQVQNYSDITYLGNTIEKLQLHLDAKKICMVTHSAPGEKLFFGEMPSDIVEQQAPISAIHTDTEKKITHWVYGSYDKTVDTTIDNINYINNSYYKRKPYWPKRVEVKY